MGFPTSPPSPRRPRQPRPPRAARAGWLATLGVPLVLACGAASAPPARSVSAGFGQATLPSGRVLALEVRRTPEERARGYMGRARVGDDEGMLFVHPEPAVRTFWMKNCLVSLDLIWMDAEHRIIFIAHDAPPCPPEGECPPIGPNRVGNDVLEIRGGLARQEGLSIGDRILISTDAPPTPEP